MRNNVWVAPGQDAQLLRKSNAPPTGDGLRGEDHGQVFCYTRDAIRGPSSFHYYNSVSFFPCCFVTASISHMDFMSPRTEKHFGRLSLILEVGLCVLFALTFTVSTRD